MAVCLLSIGSRSTLVVEVPGLSLKRSTSGYRGDREKSIPMMQADVEKHKKSIANREDRIASLISLQFTEAFDTLSLNRMKESNSQSYQNGNQYKKEILMQSKIVQNKIKNFQNQINQETRLIRSYSRNISSLQVEIHKKYSIA